MKIRSPASLLPQARSLPQQVADAIRKGLQHGYWIERLPGERDLSRQLNVSRPTVRAALAILEKEQLLDARPNRRRTIARPLHRRRSARDHIVRLLLPFPLQESPPFIFYWIDRLRESLIGSDCILEIHSGRSAYESPPETVLAELTREMPASVWLLARTNRAMQAWFARSGLPAVVVGSCYEGVDLPSVDLDQRAVARHAALQLLVRGHRRMALLVTTPAAAGDLDSERGFLAAFDQARYADATPMILRHDDSIASIRRHLDRVFSSNQNPTGLIALGSMPALAAASELTRRGFRLPHDIAFISRDSDHFLEYFSPQITRYAYSPEQFTRRVASLVVKLARDNTIPHRTIRLMPELIRGETLDP